MGCDKVMYMNIIIIISTQLAVVRPRRRIREHGKRRRLSSPRLQSVQANDYVQPPDLAHGDMAWSGWWLVNDYDCAVEH